MQSTLLRSVRSDRDLGHEITGRFFDRVPSAAEPLQGPIVKADQLPVLGHLDVELDHVGARLQGAPEGSQGVLADLTRRAAVTDDPRCARKFQVGHDVHRS